MADLNDLNKPAIDSNVNNEVLETLRGHITRLWKGDYTGMGNLVSGLRRWVRVGTTDVKLVQRNAGGTEDTLFDSSLRALKDGSNAEGTWDIDIGGNAATATTALNTRLGGGNVVTNLANGTGALAVNTTGSSNTATGYLALNSNDVGITNTAFGRSALEKVGSYGDNTAVGGYAMQNITSGEFNTAVGKYALQGSGGYAGPRLNTAIGVESLRNISGGYRNTAVGFQALSALTSNFDNTAVGAWALDANSSFDSVTGLGTNSQVTGSNQIQLGASGTTVYAYGAVQNRSDIRDKTDVEDISLGLAFVEQLRPVDFRWDMREDYRLPSESRPKPPEPLPEEATPAQQLAYDRAMAAYEQERDEWLEKNKLSNITHDGSKKRKRKHHGLIAQEVKTVMDAMGVDFGGYQDHSIGGGDDVLSIGYEELIAPLIKAVQELSAKVKALEAKA